MRMAGAVALEDIRDALYEDTLEDMKDDHFTDSLASWVEALNPQYNIANFKLD